MNGQSLRILFVEDVPSDAELAQRALKKEGLVFDALLVDTQDAFVAALEEFRPDIIISDYVMPVFDGRRALELALARNPDLPFIVYTASRNEETAVSCIKAGATNYVLKDRITRLPFAVREALEQHRIRQEKRAAEQALRESEARFRALFEQAAVGVAQVETRSGRFVRINQRYCDLMGYSRAEMLAMNFQQITHPDDLEHDLANMERLLTNQIREFTIEKRYVRKNGSVMWGHLTVSPMWMPGQPPDYHIAIAEDITERKRAEETLRVSEERFRILVNSLDDVVYTLDTEQRHIGLYGKWVEKAGLTPAFFLGKTARDIFGPASAAVHESANRRALAGETAVYEWSAVAASGIVHYQTVVSPLRDATGTITGIVGVGRDMTASKQSEAAIQASESQYRSLFENVAVPIWEADFSELKQYLDGLRAEGLDDLRAYLDTHPERVAHCASLIKIITANQASLIVFQAQRQDEITLYSADYFVEESWEVFKDEVLALMEGNTTFEGEFAFHSGKGKINRGILRASVVPGFEDTLDRVLVSFIDITDRKEMEETLSTLSRRLFEAQEAERRNVARELHDEIGQVLTAVKSNLQTSRLLSDRLMSASFLEESIGIVDKALQQVRDLSLNLRPSLLDDFGLVPALEWYLNRQAARLNLIAEFIAKPREMELPQTLATTCFRVAQAALTNIERHAHAKHVSIELYWRDVQSSAPNKQSELLLTIRDDGVGFDTEAMLENARRGITLGLTGMQERVRLAGGQIEIHSRLKRGTEILARFPIVQPNVERRSKRRME